MHPLGCPHTEDGEAWMGRARPPPKAEMLSQAGCFVQSQMRAGSYFQPWRCPPMCGTLPLLHAWQMARAAALNGDPAKASLQQPHPLLQLNPSPACPACVPLLSTSCCQARGTVVEECVRTVLQWHLQHGFPLPAPLHAGLPR